MKKNVLLRGLLGITLLTSVGFLTSAETFASDVQYQWGLVGVSYTTRAQWGADETRRHTARPEYQRILNAQAEAAKNPKPETEASRRTKIANQYVSKNFLEYFKVDSIIRNEGGDDLFWSLQYVNAKKKIMLHHTADTKTLPETIAQEKEYMQNLYKYHAFSNGWGDIGYNFIIMPSGRIYEGKAGGAGVVGAHATWNNTNSVGISLVGNFHGIDKPTQAQIDSLVNLSASVAQKYGLRPDDQTYYFKKSNVYPYVHVSKDYVFGAHRDGGITACPGDDLYAMMPLLRARISQKLLTLGNIGTTTTLIPTIPTTTTATTTQTSTPTTIARRPAGTTRQIVPVGPQVESMSQLTQTQYANQLQQTQPQTSQQAQQKPTNLQLVRSNYLDTHAFSASRSVINRLSGAPLVENLEKITNQLVRVLLYEASSLPKRDISCDPACSLRYISKTHIVKNISVEPRENYFALTFTDTSGEKKVTARAFGLNAYNSTTNSGVITIDNYARKASNGIGLNSFRQGLLFSFGEMKNEAGKSSVQPLVINLVSLDNYMRGIAEASDNEVQAKADLLALLSKTYALYYMGGEITHPSIPAGSVYNAIDDPRFFQKYLGEGWEKISKKRPVALQNTQGQYLVYNKNLPILPYFHCSAGFTWSGQEKRGWQDTPYLQSTVDSLGACSDYEFQGHGVGLSGKGAAAMLANGSTVQQVISTYYPGVTILKK